MVTIIYYYQIGKSVKLARKSSASSSLATSKSRSFSFLHLWRLGRSSSKELQSPLTTIEQPDKTRMQEIEEQIADLSGSVYLQVNTAVVGGNAPTTSSYFRFKINVAQVEPERNPSMTNLASFYRTSEVVGRSSNTTLASPLHEWNFSVSRIRSRSSNYNLNELSNFGADSESWKFSSIECILPMEPCAILTADVSSLVIILFPLLIIETQRLKKLVIIIIIAW